MCTWGAMQRNGLKRLRHHFTSAMPGCSGSSSSTHSPPDKCAYSRQLSTQRPPDVVFQEMGRAVSVGKTALPVATAAPLLNLLGLHSCYSRSGSSWAKHPNPVGKMRSSTMFRPWMHLDLRHILGIFRKHDHDGAACHFRRVCLCRCKDGQPRRRAGSW